MRDRSTKSAALHRPRRPFRATIFRGLSVLLPPLMTIVFFVWIGSTVNQNVLRPVEDGLRNALVLKFADIRVNPPGVTPGDKTAYLDGISYLRLESGEFVPAEIAQFVREQTHSELLPTGGRAVYERYIDLRFLQPQVVVPAFVCTFLLVIYLLGKFFAAEVGSFVWGMIEWAIGRLPLIRNVYTSVKQVTDFMLNERPFKFTRVVAVEYPCPGVWSVGFVTSESLKDIRAAVNEPVFAVLVPCSPMPMAARSVVVRQREVVELNMTVDQALQFIVSCGVVVPPQLRIETVKLGATPNG